MNLLLDTHAYLWWVLDDAHLSSPARDAIANPDNRVFLSAASVYEMRYKHGRGRLPGAERLFENWDDNLATDGFEPLGLTHHHALTAAALPDRHRDPFDRMIVATAICDGLTLVTRDPLNQGYGASLLW
ncbi:MAG: type II toxin-antitoxin system VapC family toxin [Pseudomonadota bacterium]